MKPCQKINVSRAWAQRILLSLCDNLAEAMFQTIDNM